MRQQLEATLEELHEQLHSVDNLDSEQIHLLRSALEEIQTTLDRSDVSSSTLGQRLRDATRQFSQSHPVLTDTAGKIADLLSQMGI